MRDLQWSRFRGWATMSLICLFLLANSAQAQFSAVGGSGGRGGRGGSSGSRSGSRSGSSQGGGILIDTQGVVRPAFAIEVHGKLSQKRLEAWADEKLPQDVNQVSPLRKISLVKLEAALAECARNQSEVPLEMQFLAGLQRIDYVFVYPKEKDLVIAGPAEGFVVDDLGRATGVGTLRPAIRLDDLLVALRSVERGGVLGCSIDPVEQNLAKLKSFVASQRGATTPQAAEARFRQMPGILGMQDVRVFGVSSETHFAEALVEADYRMKCLTIGVDRSPVRGLRSFLSMVKPGSNSVQRWWFTPRYDTFTRTEDGQAYQFAGQRVCLRSQQELVSDTGARSNAATTDPLLLRYAKLFTDKYPELADAVTIFGELQNLFDVSVLAALMKKDHLPDNVQWDMALFLDDEKLPIIKRTSPRQVPTLINFHRSRKGLYVALIGGGVQIDPLQTVQQIEYRSDDGKLQEIHDDARSATPSPKHHWWWD